MVPSAALIAFIQAPLHVAVQRDWADWVLWSGSVLLAVVGIVGVIFAILNLKAIKLLERQTIATEKAAAAAKRTSITAKRTVELLEAADVLIESVGLVPPGPITPGSHPALRIKNFGRTRAENVGSSIVLKITGLPDSIPSPETFTLGPGGSQLIGFLNFKDFMNPPTFQEIVAGKRTVRFAGSVTYSDIFGGQRSFECKGVLDPVTGTFILGENNPRGPRAHG